MDLTNLDTDPVTAVDPNELLARLREACRQTLADLDDPATSDDVTVNESNMAEAFLQLDDWVSRGGFLPGAWQDTDE
jgi:hypothetical protein